MAVVAVDEAATRTEGIGVGIVLRVVGFCGS